MATKFDIPSDLKQLYKYFTELQYKDDMASILDNLLTLMIRGFSLTPNLYDDEAAQITKRYTEKERHIYGAMIKEVIMIYHKRISSDIAWTDVFGDLYMSIASNSKQSALGQFFTPECVVDAMVKISVNNEMTGQRFSDPACGSGRLLIAAHAYAPGNYCYAEDLDMICCKMATINMMMHGCKGEVVCHDSLMQKDYRFGFKINPHFFVHGVPGVPHIEVLEREDSFIMQSAIKREARPVEEKPVLIKEQVKQVIHEKPAQLSLF